MRRWRSFVRAFSHGIMLTGLPVVAFLAFDYLMAPPAGSGRADLAQRQASAEPRGPRVPTAGDADRQWKMPDDVAEATRVTRPQIESFIKAAIGDSASGGRSSLVVSIQEELRRVGCYVGDVDGTWNEKTKSAMRAFNASVHVNVSADRADYLLLTLLQSHSSKACTQPCGGDRAGACVDRSIEARGIAPSRLPAEGHAARDGGKSELTSIVMPGTALLQKSPSATNVVLVAPSQAAVDPVAVRKWDGAAMASTAGAEPLARDGIVSSAPLPGRMAVGAVDATDGGVAGDAADPASQAEAEALTVDALAAAAAVRPKPALAGASQPKRSFSFSDLTRSAP